MQFFAFSFKVLSLTGIWQPIHWKSRKLIFCYKIFSIITIFGSYSLTALQVILLTTIKFDVKKFNEILFALIPFTTVCTKIFNFVARRQDIIELDDMLMVSYCIPRDIHELEMQTKCKKFVRFNTILLNSLALLTVCFFALIPVLQGSQSRSLLFRMWLPYELGSARNYWLTYVAQLIPLIYGATLNCTIDFIINGFMMQICIQLDVLNRRLQMLPRRSRVALRNQVPVEKVTRFEDETVRQAVGHHDFLINFARRINETFNIIIIEQCFTTTLVLSIIVYELTTGNVGILQYAMDVGYLCCMLAEFFCFCWFGNEVTTKCQEFGIDLYKIDWTQLTARTNRSLLIIMLRSTKAVIVRSGYFAILDVNSFKNILKISYSAFNLLNESTR